jgi:hypothetical protein
VVVVMMVFLHSYFELFCLNYQSWIGHTFCSEKR